MPACLVDSARPVVLRQVCELAARRGARAIRRRDERRPDGARFPPPNSRVVVLAAGRLDLRHVCRCLVGLAGGGRPARRPRAFPARAATGGDLSPASALATAAARTARLCVTADDR